MPRKKKCKNCLTWYEVRPEHQAFQCWCSTSCAIDIGIAKHQKAQERRRANVKREAAKTAKAGRAQHRADKERVKPRSYWLDKLQALVNQYAKHVVHKGQPCYTCGLKQRFEDKPQSFHAGHFIPAKTADPRRFMLEVLRIQCNACNTHNSGMRLEYKERLIEEMGIDHVEWLECDANHPGLKERFPHYSDIKAEIARYRQLLRDAGLVPRK